MSENAVCPVCKNPKKSESAGSLTQWIVACNCDAKKTADTAEDRVAVDLCRTCGKRIGEGRAGSFTQFVFRSDVCRCRIPKPLRDALEAAPEPEHYLIEEDDAPDLPVDPDSFPVQRYKPISELGSGAFGAVYLAIDKLLNKKVAVKILHMLETKQLVAFQDEARATSRLTHPGIVGLIDFGITQSAAPYMVLDYVPGLSLEEVLRRDGQLNVEMVRIIFRQVCDALAYAHAMGVYHRDIKPSNILLVPSRTEAYKVRLIDFGIAKVRGREETSQASQTHTLVGAPLYMSPDVGLGKPYDERSEVYSLGCVLFEALAGRPPFVGENVYQTLNLHADQTAPALAEACDDVFPKAVEELVARALRKEPAERYQNMSEFRQAIVEVGPANADVIDKLADTISATVPKKTVSKSFLFTSVCIAIFLTILLTTPNMFHPRPTVEIPKAPRKPLQDELKIHSYIQDEEHLLPNEQSLNGELKISDDTKWELEEKAELTGYNVSDEDFRKIDDIPANPQIRLNVHSTATGTGFRYVAKIPFWCVNIQCRTITDDGLIEIAKIKTIRRFCLEDSPKITERGLEAIAGGLPNLDHVKLRFFEKLPPHAFRALASSKTLRGLDIGHSKGITQGMFREMAQIKNLADIEVTNTNFDDQTIEIIKALPLRVVEFNQTRVTGKGLLSLASIRTLAHIGIEPSAEINQMRINQFKRLRPDVTIAFKEGVHLEDAKHFLPIGELEKFAPAK